MESRSGSPPQCLKHLSSNTDDGISDDDADLPPGPISQVVVDLTKRDPISTSVVVKT